MSEIKLCSDCGKPMTEEEIYYLYCLCTECETIAYNELVAAINQDRVDATGEG